MKRLDRTEIIFKLLSYALLTVFAICCLYPFLYVLVNSISAKEAVDSGKVNLIPLIYTLEKKHNLASILNLY